VQKLKDARNYLFWGSAKIWGMKIKGRENKKCAKIKGIKVHYDGIFSE